MSAQKDVLTSGHPAMHKQHILTNFIDKETSMKFNKNFQTIVSRALSKGLIPMLLGEPGIGKSSWVMDLGKTLQTAVFVLPCNQLADKADMTGARLVPITEKVSNPDGTTTEKIVDYEQVFYPHSVINQAIKYANEHPNETPILFMDEINRTTPDVTSEALSIPTLRSIGNKHLPDNLRVIVAGNDKGNVVSLDDASISRFVLYHVTPDVDTFLNLSKELNPFIKKTLQAHPETIFCKQIRVQAGTAQDDDGDEVDIDEIVDEGGEMNQIATPRTIMGLSEWLNSFSNSELMAMCADVQKINGEDVSVLQECLEGHTGKTMFTQFLLAEIASNIQNTNNQANVITVNKPAIYDAMKAAQDVTALNTLIGTMTDVDKSACMVYALYEKADNAIYIQALADAIANMTPQDSRQLMSLQINDMLDEDNKNALINSNAPIAQTLSIILSA